MEFTKLGIAKGVVSLVVGSGISSIVVGVAKNNTSPEKVHQKVAIVSGAFVVGAVLADKAKEYTDQQIDDIADWYNKNVKPKLQK